MAHRRQNSLTQWIGESSPGHQRKTLNPLCAGFLFCAFRDVTAQGFKVLFQCPRWGQTRQKQLLTSKVLSPLLRAQCLSIKLRQRGEHEQSFHPVRPSEPPPAPLVPPSSVH